MMSFWEKTIGNVQRGHERLLSFAATFSERLRAEINIVRLKIQIEGLRRQISEQHQIIGRKALELKVDGSLPRTWELFFQLDDVAAAVENAERLEKEEEILQDDLQHEADMLKQTPSRQEERSA